jgi:hypothetical protein
MADAQQSQAKTDLISAQIEQTRADAMVKVASIIILHIGIHRAYR